MSCEPVARSHDSHVVLDDVSMIYQSDSTAVHALQHVTLAVHCGEIVCIVGPSGCGKTTLVNLIGGFIQPTSGRVTIQGNPVERPGKTAAVVFQTDSIFPWMRVIDNVAYGPRVQHLDNISEIVDRCLRLVDMAGFSRHWPRQLSGGMRKRVELARALAADPAILLLDEPFASLDVFTRENLQSVLLKLWDADNKSVILVTHDIEEALYLGHRIIVLSPRPGHVRGVIDVPFPMPRPQSIRFSAKFAGLRRELMDLMGGELSAEEPTVQNPGGSTV